MAEYNLNDTAQPITVSFSPISVPMTAHFVHWDETGDWVEAKPVLGVLVRHVVNAQGEVTEDRVDMAIQIEDRSELCTPAEYLSCLGWNGVSLVGIRPSADPPSAAEIERVVATGRKLEQLDAQRRAAS